MQAEIIIAVFIKSKDLYTFIVQSASIRDERLRSASFHVLETSTENRFCRGFRYAQSYLYGLTY